MSVMSVKYHSCNKTPIRLNHQILGVRYSNMVSSRKSASVHPYAVPIYTAWWQALRVVLYCQYVSLIYIRYFHLKISDIFDIYDFYGVFFFKIFNVTHCDYFWCQQSVCFGGLWLVPSAFSQCWTTSVRLHLSTAMQCEWREYFT